MYASIYWLAILLFKSPCNLLLYNHLNCAFYDPVIISYQQQTNVKTLYEHSNSVAHEECQLFIMFDVID